MSCLEQKISMKNKKIFKINRVFELKKIFLVFIFCGIIFPFFSFADLDMSKLTYKPLEEIPGFGKPTSYTEYILALYDFGLWTVGISAVLMISFGAFMYITSAGNSSTTGKAKGIIADAIAGVILALVSYVLIYTINPTLLNINSPSLLVGGISGGSGSATLGTKSASGGGSTSKGYTVACPDSGSTAKIDYSGAKSDSSIKPDSNCDQYDEYFKTYGNKYTVKPEMLKAIAQIESSCGKNMGPSSSGACGLMQILPKTANATCEKLTSDAEFSIKTAAKLISENMQSSCVNNSNDAIFAGYNSGYGCGSDACSPKKHALCASSDCSGSMAFQCCKNPGALSQSISYAWNGIGLMSKVTLSN
jgi:hypothetical protein